MNPREPVVMFSDYACPWCYLGRARLVRAIEPGQLTQLHRFPLSPDAPAEGRDIVAYLRAKGLDVRAALAHVVGQRGVVGAQSVEVLQQLLGGARA